MSGITSSLRGEGGGGAVGRLSDFPSDLTVLEFLYCCFRSPAQLVPVGPPVKPLILNKAIAYSSIGEALKPAHVLVAKRRSVERNVLVEY